jgi:tetratricopeptide (TPR) repeat protein
VIGDMAFKDGNYVQAALAFQDALTRKPEAAGALFALADALIALRNYGYASDCIRGGLSAAPRWADDLDRHGVYGQEGHLERHLAEVTEFAELYPRDRRAWFLLGYLRMTSGIEEERDQAAAAFRRAADLDPDDRQSLRYLELLED